MSVQRQDYILRQIALLRQFAARLANRRSDLELEEALLLSFHLQEKLLPLPPAEFLKLDLATQIEALRHNETPAAAHEKCLAYAGLLAETAALYDFKGRPDLADGARQMALYAALGAASEQPHDAAAGELIDRLAGQLDPTALHAPVAELLAEFRRPHSAL
jgi:hypothetical protein